MKSNWNYPTTVWVGKDRIKDRQVKVDPFGILRMLEIIGKELMIKIFFQ